MSERSRSRAENPRSNWGRTNRYGRWYALGRVMTLLAMAALPVQTVRAATVSWDAGSTTDFLWDTLTNWSADLKPTAIDDAIFVSPVPNPGSLSDPSIITVGTGALANSLTFRESYTLSGGDLTLSSNNITVVSGATANISSALTMSGGGLTLAANNGILGDTGGGTLVVSGAANNYAGTTTVNAGTLSLSGNTARSGATTVNSGGTLSAAVTSASNPLGTGAISLNSGVLDLTPTASTATAGLSGRQFASTTADTARIDFTQTAASTRTDGTINFGSFTSAQAVQWTGKIQITNAGDYTFQIGSDDGSRLYIDGVLVVQNDGPKGELAGTSSAITLSAGLHDIRMDYVNSGGNGAARLRYAGPDIGGTQTIIPSSVLFAAESNTTAGARNAVIIGSGIGNTLNVNGASSINLNGSDFTQVQMGDVNFGNASQLNVVTSAGVNGKGLRLAGNAVFGTGVTLNGVGDGTNGADIYFDGALSDGGVATTITKTGNGRLIFSNTTSANSLLAGTTLDIQAGTLNLIGSSATGSFNPIGAAGITLSGGRMVLDSKIGSASALSPTVFNNAITVTQDATIQDISTGGSITSLGGPISIAATKTLTLDAIAGGNPATSLGAVLNVSGALSGSGTLNVISTKVGTLTITPVSGSTILTGNNTGFTGAVTVGSSGILTAATVNSLSGNTVTLNNGTLNYFTDGDGTGQAQNLAYNNNLILSGGAGTIGLGRLGLTYLPLFTTAANKTIQVNTLTTNSQALTVNNGNGYGLEVTGLTTLGSGAESITVGTGTSVSPGVVQGLTLSGKVTGTPTGLTKAGAGTLVLTNATNDFTGPITVTGGVLGASSDAALGNAANTITLNNAAGTAAFEAFGTFATSRTINFGSTTTGNNLISVSGGNTLTLNSALTGANGFQKSDPGILALNNNNAGFSGPITGSGGIIRLTNSGGLGTGVLTMIGNIGTALQLDGSGGALSVGNNITINGSGLNNTGSLQNIAGSNAVTGTITLGGAAAVGADLGTTLSIGAVSAGANVLTLAGAGTGNVTGAITSTGAGGLVKHGSGSWTVSATPVSVGTTLQILQGTLTLSGAGKYNGTGTPILSQAGTLVLDNSTTNDNNRLNGRFSNMWFAGELRILGNAGAATNETTGNATNLTFSNAGGIITLLPDAAQPIVFGSATTFPISRNGTSTMLFRAPGLGTNSGATAGTGTIKFSNVTFTGQTGVAGTYNRGILPWALAETTGTGWGSALATYDATNGIRPLGQVAGETVSTLVGLGNVSATGALTATTGTTLINSLTLGTGGGVSIPAGSSLQLDSGALLALPGNVGITGGALATLGGSANKEIILHVVHPTGGSASLGMGAALVGTNGFIKADNGTLSLDVRSFVTGQTSINGGTLTLNAGNNTLLPGQNLAAQLGGTLNLNGNAQLIGDLYTASTGGNEAVQAGGNVITGTGGVLAINQSNTGRTYAGAISGAGALYRGGLNTLSLTEDNTYTGTTVLAGGTTSLVDDGRLSATTAIDIHNGILLIKNDGLANNNDRVNDAATITLRTGQVQFKNRAQTNSFEQLGALVLAQGNNELNVGDLAGTGINSSELRFTSISQSAAAYNGGTGLDSTTNFQKAGGQVGSAARMFFGNGLSLVSNNILPVWIEHGGNEFVTYTPTLGVAPLSAQGAPGYTGTTLPTADSGATAVGNYRIGASGVVPTGGLTVNTLNVNGAFNVTFGTATDVLNVAAGGLMKTGTTGTLIGSVVDEGRLTAGGAAPVGTQRLHLFDVISGQSMTINSRIIDNGGSAVRVIINNYNGGIVGLANGNNSYTGGTVVNGWNGNGSGGLNLAGGVGAVVIPAGGLTINNATVAMITNAGQINSANDIYINSGGVLTLVGANTLQSLNFDNLGGTANPTINTGGVLSLGVGGGIVANSSNIGSVSTINGTLDLGAVSRTVNTGAVTLNGAAIAPFTASLNIAGVVQNGSINKTGLGNLQLSGQGTFAGGVNLTAGGLIIGANSIPASGTVISGPLGTGTLTASAGTTILSSGNFAVGNNLTLLGGLNFNGVNNVTFNGTTTLPGGSIGIDVALPQQTVALVGPMVNPTTTINKTGYGTLALSSAYAGTLNVAGGTIGLLDDGNGTGVPQTIVFPMSINSGGATTLNVGRVGTTFAPYFATASNKTIQVANFSNGGAAVNVSNNAGYGVDLTGNFAMTNDQTYTVVNASASNLTQGLTLSGQLSGGFNLTKLGAGTLVLGNATNSFGGVGNLIDIQGGVVAAGSDTALGNLNNSIRLNAPGTSNVGLRATGTFSTARVLDFAAVTNAIEVTGGNTLTLTTGFTGLSGTTQLVKNDNGALELSVANSVSWNGSITAAGASAQVLTGGVLVNAGVVRILDGGALGAATNVIAVNNTQGAAVEIGGGITVPNPIVLNTQTGNSYAGGINWGGGLRSVGNGLTNTWSGAISENQDAGISADANNTLNLTGGINQNAHIVVYNGAGTINVTTNAITAVHTIDRIGSGTTNIQVTTAGPTGNGIRVFSGNLTFSGAGAVTGGGTVATVINPGGTVNLDSSGTVTNNRLGTGRGITFVGGNLNLIGGATTTTETIAAPAFNRGQSTITVTSGAGGADLRFSAASNNVNPSQGTGGSGATVLFRGTSLGTAAGAGVSSIAWTAGGLLFNGQTGATGTTTKGIAPWAIIDTTASGLGTSFVTADSAAAATNTGTAILRPLAAGEYSTATTLAATANMLVTTAIVNGVTVAPNSLTIDTGGSIAMNAGQTLSLSSGGILVRNGVTSTISGGLAVQPAANSAWNIHTVGTAALTISSLMSGGQQADRIGLVKAGGGTLTLSTPTVSIAGLTTHSANTLNMQTAINQGTLVLNGGRNTLGVNKQLEVGAGATLDLNGTSQYVSALFTDGTFNGMNAVTSGGTIISTPAATLVTNSDARNWSGAITGNIFYNRTGTNTTTTMYNAQTYTGGTLINSGTVQLRDYAALANTSAIEIALGGLTIDNTGSANLTNRVVDSAPINMQAGTITMLGRAQTDSTETLGAVSLVGGLNVIDVRAGGTGVNSAVLTLTSLARPAGATSTVIFGRGSGEADQNGQLGSAARMLVSGGLTLSNNIVGPWAIMGREWASYNTTLGAGQLNATGFAGYSPTAIGANPTATDNVQLINASGAITADTTVNTFKFGYNGNQTLDLGTRKLTVQGGGLMLATGSDNVTATISNGSITSGFANGAVNDLYVYHLPYAGTNRQSAISAVIADNGATPVRLVVTSSEGSGSANRLRLEGANTYTGGTVVNGGTLLVGAGGVVPAGGISLNNASLTQAIAGQASLGTINAANVVTLNGNSAVNLVGNNTLAGLVFNNNGGAANPTVNTFIAGLGTDGKGTLTIGASGITASSSNVQTTSTIVGRIDTGAAPTTITVNPILVNGESVAPLQATLAIQGWVGSSGTITKAGAGVLQLNAQSTFTGTLNVTGGGINIGTLSNTGLAGGSAAGSRYSQMNLAAGTFLNLNNTDATIGSLAGAGNVFNQTYAAANGQAAATGRTFNVGFDNSNTTFSGGFVRWSDQLAATFQVNKIGTGTMTLTGVSNTTSNLQVSQGGVTFAGAGTGLFGTNIVLPTGTLTLDNSATNVNHRLTGGLGTGGTLQLAGGSFRIIGNSGAATSETIGTINFGGITNPGGTSVVTLEANAAQPLTLTAGAFGGLSTNTGLIRGISATAGNGLANFALNAVGLGAPTGAGAGANGTTIMPIRPDLLGDASISGTGTGFITKDSATNFLRPLQASEMTATVFSGASTSTVNYGLSANAPLFAGGQFGSLTLNSGGGLSQHTALAATQPDGLSVNPQVVSGGILAFTGNAGITTGRLQTANNTAFYIHTLGNLNVSSVLNGTTGGLMKDGAGTLTLGARNLYTGQTNVNGGTLVLNGGDNTLTVLVTGGAPTGLATAVNAGTLDLNGNNQIVAPIFSNGSARYNGSGGTFTNTAGGAPVTLTTNMTSAQVFSGSLAGNLNFNKTGNNALTMTSPTTHTGATTVRANTLNLIDGGTLSNTSAVNLFFGGLNIDQSGLNPVGNNNPVRIPAATPVNLRGGTITLTPGGSSDSTQTINTVNLVDAHNTLSVPQAPISGFGALTIGNLVRTNLDATINLTGGTGGFFSNNPGLNQSQLFINQIDGVAIPATITGKILGGWALASNGEFVTAVQAGTTGSNGINWGIITLNGTTGPLGTLVQDRYDATAISAAGTATTNVRLGAAGTLVAGGTTFNSLAVRDAAYTVTFGATDVMNLASGGLALTNGGTVFGATAGQGRLTSGGTATGLSRLYIYQNGANSTVNTVIQNSGVAGASTRLVLTPIANQLILTAANTYTGGTVINGAGGGVTLSGGAGVVVIPTGGLTINNATITMNTNAGQIAAGNDVTINGGGGITFVGSNTINSLTFNNIGGTGNPTIGAATGLTLSAANAITAVNDNVATVPTISGTSLILGNAAPVINSSTTVGVPTDLSITAPITSVGGAISKTGTGSLVLAPATAALTVTNTSGTAVITTTATAGLQVGQGVTGTGVPAGATIASITPGVSFTISANTTAAATSVTINGSTFTNGLNLNAGTLILGTSSNPTTGTVLSGPVGTGTLTMADGTALISDGTIRTIANNVVLAGNITFGSNAGVSNASSVAGNGVILNGGFDLGAGTSRSINVNSFLNTSTLGGIVSGVGSSLIKTGPGTLALTGVNTYDGGTFINGGILQSNATGLPATGVVTFGGGILQHAAATTTDFSGKISTANNQPIYIDTNSQTITYATALSSATGGSLGKFGAGTLILTAAANYDGPTLINAGTLQIGAGGLTGSIPTTSNILNGGVFAVNRDAADLITHSGSITGGGGLTIDQATFKPSGLVNLGGNLTFGSANTVTTTGTLDLTNVDATFGGLVVQNNNATGSNVVIPAGRTLNVSGNVTVGLDSPGAPNAMKLSMGSGGAFVVNNPLSSFTVAARTVNVNQTTTATLDLTGLASSTINVGNLYLGRVTNGSVNAAQTTGILKLATDNTITAATQVLLGDSGSTGNANAVSTMTIGTGNTTVTTPLVVIGGRKSKGKIDFAAGGTLTLNNGANPTDLYIGRNNLNTGTVADGVFDSTGGTFIANLGNLIIAEKTGGGAGGATGTFTLGTSALNNITANSIQLTNLSGGGTATATLTLNGGTVTLAAAGSGITDGTGTSTLTLNGAILDLSGKAIGTATDPINTLNLQAGTLKNVAQINGGAAIAKTTAGTLVIDGVNAYTGATAVNGGTLQVNSSIATSASVTVATGATFVAGATQVVKTLDLSAATSNASILAGAIRVLSVGDNTAASPLTLTGGKMDLNTSALMVDFTAGNEAANLTALKTAIIAGRGTGVWDGTTGITSTAAALSPSVYGIGYAPSSVAAGAIAGVTPDASTVVARYTRLGDANLDGAVNFFDLTALAAAYGAAGEWFNGDFDYSGDVNFFDLTALAANYGTGLPSEAIPGATPEFSADLAAAFASVPEPGAISLLGLAALALLKRRNNRKTA